LILLRNELINLWLMVWMSFLTFSQVPVKVLNRFERPELIRCTKQTQIKQGAAIHMSDTDSFWRRDAPHLLNHLL